MTLLDLAAGLLKVADLPGDEPKVLLPDEVETWPEDTLEALSQIGLVTEGAAATRLSCSECDEHHSEAVSWSDDRPFIVCPSQGRVWLEDGQLRRWEISPQSLAAQVCAAAGTGMSPTEVAQGRHWYLGSLPGQPSVNLHLVRGVGWRDGDAIFGPLAASSANLLLGFDVAPPKWLPANQFASLASLLRLESGQLIIAANGVVSAARGPSNSMTRKDSQWLIRWRGEETTVRDYLGLTYIAILLRDPYSETPALRLLTLAGGQIDRALTTADGLSEIGASTEDVIDAEARTQLQVRVAELDRKKRTSGLTQDQEREKDFLQNQLRQASGLGGRTRKVTGPVEAARSSVTNAIVRAQREIARRDPVLGEHLRSTIKRGASFSYRPVEPLEWQITLS